MFDNSTCWNEAEPIGSLGLYASSGGRSFILYVRAEGNDSFTSDHKSRSKTPARTASSRSAPGRSRNDSFTSVHDLKSKTPARTATSRPAPGRIRSRGRGRPPTSDTPRNIRRRQTARHKKVLRALDEAGVSNQDLVSMTSTHGRAEIKGRVAEYGKTPLQCRPCT